MAKTAGNPDPAYQTRLAHYERLTATIPEVERKGAANPYTSFNGHMFSYLHPGGAVALRLPPAEREAFLQTYGTTLIQAYGVVQKEYDTVPDDPLPDTEQLRRYFRSGYDFVKPMKPKPTGKKKA